MVSMNLRMERNSLIKTAVTVVAVVAFAVFFYRLFNPRDIPALLTYVIFFIIPPSYIVYAATDKAVDRLARKKTHESPEVIE